MNIPRSKKEWTCAKTEKPEEYDLVLLETSKGKRVPGWWSGIGWDGQRLRKEDEVVAFKSVDFQVNNASQSYEKKYIKLRKYV